MGGGGDRFRATWQGVTLHSDIIFAGVSATSSSIVIARWPIGAQEFSCSSSQPKSPASQRWTSVALPMANVDAESAAASEAPQIENEPVAEAGGSADCNRFSQHGIKLVVKKLATENRPHGADATTDSTARSSSGDVPVSAREQLSILIEQPEGDVIGERIKGLQRHREELQNNAKRRLPQSSRRKGSTR